MVVVTRGSRGCEIFCPGENGIVPESVCIPAFKVAPVDTTGAGDTFNASFLYGISQKWDVKKAGVFANAAAARAILYRGARSGAVGKQEVEKFLKNV
jgi:ribokinase